MQTLQPGAVAGDEGHRGFRQAERLRKKGKERRIGLAPARRRADPDRQNFAAVREPHRSVDRVATGFRREPDGESDTVGGDAVEPLRGAVRRNIRTAGSG